MRRSSHTLADLSEYVLQPAKGIHYFGVEMTSGAPDDDVQTYAM